MPSQLVPHIITSITTLDLPALASLQSFSKITYLRLGFAPRPKQASKPRPPEGARWSRSSGRARARARQVAAQEKKASTSKRMPEQQRGTVMRLHLVRGSFCTSDEEAAGGGGGCPSMDAEVWSKLPDEIIWDVLLLLPAAKHFQLQLVSRKWRQLLTSSHFRNKVMAAAPGEREQQQQQCVVACVSDGDDPDNSSSSSNNSGNNSSNKVNSKVVDIDLSSFVPNWFWNSKSDTYSLVAVGAGLVCISNNNEFKHYGFLDEEWSAPREEKWEPWKPWTNQYCVINPVTRTCTVLPKLPFKPLGWLPLTTGTLTIYKEWEVATCDLAGGGGWVLAAHDFGPLNSWEGACMELCGGETYRYHAGQVLVLVPGPAAPGWWTRRRPWTPRRCRCWAWTRPSSATWTRTWTW